MLGVEFAYRIVGASRIRFRGSRSNEVNVNVKIKSINKKLLKTQKQNATCYEYNKLSFEAIILN